MRSLTICVHDLSNGTPRTGVTWQNSLFHAKAQRKIRAQRESRMSLRTLFIMAPLRKTLTNPDPVVTIQCRRIRNDDSIAFAQPVEYLDRADGVASEFNCATLCLGAVRAQHKHADGLLCLTKRRPANFQDVFKSLELDRSVDAQIRSR